MIFACFVSWMCNPFFGLIAFILAGAREHLPQLISNKISVTPKKSRQRLREVGSFFWGGYDPPLNTSSYQFASLSLWWLSKCSKIYISLFKCRPRPNSSKYFLEQRLPHTCLRRKGLGAPPHSPPYNLHCKIPGGLASPLPAITQDSIIPNVTRRVSNWSQKIKQRHFALDQISPLWRRFDYCKNLLILIFGYVIRGFGGRAVYSCNFQYRC